MTPTFQRLNMMKDFLVLVTVQGRWAEGGKLPHADTGDSGSSHLTRGHSLGTPVLHSGKGSTWKVLGEVSGDRAWEWGVSVPPDLSYTTGLIPREARCSGGKDTGFDKQPAALATKL